MFTDQRLLMPVLTFARTRNWTDSISMETTQVTQSSKRTRDNRVESLKYLDRSCLRSRSPQVPPGAPSTPTAQRSSRQRRCRQVIPS